MSRKKTKILELSEFCVFIFFKTLFRAVPLKVAFFIFRQCIRVYYYLDTKHRKRTCAHLIHAGITEDKSKAEIIAKKVYRHFAEVTVEIIKLDQMLKHRKISDIITISGDEDSKKEFFTGKNPAPAIIVTAHMGNWEMAGRGYCAISGNNLTTVMRKFDNEKIGNYVYKQRIGKKHKLCPKKNAIKSLLKALKKGESVCLISDQHASTSEGVETLFFGHPARTHFSAAMLHLKTGVPILIAVSKKINNEFKYEFKLAPAIKYKPTENHQEDIQKVAQLYTSYLETFIKETPEQWMWTHRRWLDINRNKSKNKTKDVLKNEKKQTSELS